MPIRRACFLFLLLLAVLPPALASPPTLDGAAVLLYFDQDHLTPSGREDALHVAGKLVDELVASGAVVSVVSLGPVRETFADFTSDEKTLRASIRALRADRDHVNPAWRQQGSGFTETVKGRPGPAGRHGVDGGFHCDAARQRQTEETERARRAFDELSTELDRFTESATRKIAIYFAENARSTARHQTSGVRGCPPLNEDATRSLRSLVAHAVEAGVRVYPWRPATLIELDDQLASGDAQDTLKTLATGTGGVAMLRAPGAKKVLKALNDER